MDDIYKLDDGMYIFKSFFRSAAGYRLFFDGYGSSSHIAEIADDVVVVEALASSHQVIISGSKMNVVIHQPDFGDTAIFPFFHTPLFENFTSVFSLSVALSHTTALTWTPICSASSMFSSKNVALPRDLLFKFPTNCIVVLLSPSLYIITKKQRGFKIVNKLREHYESQLKIVGLDLTDLDDDIQVLLNEYVDLQQCTNLYDLRLSNLKSFYYEKKREHIEHGAFVKRLENEIEKQESDLEKNQAECALLEKFIEVTNKRLVSESAMENEKLNVESNMKILNEKLNNLNIPEDIPDIDELIRKLNS
uniref:Uncharacterized protein n=1 Tax=Glossina austeni TaxID=7395 RepID=A0A1A9UTE4_GLOAU